MSNILMETLTLEGTLPESKLNYLEEYLVVTDTLTIEEAKRLIKIAHTEAKLFAVLIESAIENKIIKMKSDAAHMVDSGKWTRGEAQAYISRQTKAINASGKYAGMGNKVALAKKVGNIKARFGALSKLGKAGVIAGGVATAGGLGYGAYRLNKQRQAKAAA